YFGWSLSIFKPHNEPQRRYPSSTENFSGVSKYFRKTLRRKNTCWRPLPASPLNTAGSQESVTGAPCSSWPTIKEPNAPRSSRNGSLYSTGPGHKMTALPINREMHLQSPVGLLFHAQSSQ